MEERKTLCDLRLIGVDFGWSEARAGASGNTFRITFRHLNGQQTGRIDVDEDVSERFAVELAAAAALIRTTMITQKKAT